MRSYEVSSTGEMQGNNQVDGVGAFLNVMCDHI